jgi:hypothetical protein
MRQRARPDLWEPREGNLPGPPEPQKGHPSIASERPRRSTAKRGKPNWIYWKNAALPREIEATIMLIRSEK